MPDWWENLYNLDPFNGADANLDSDGDGLTNLQEYLAGTNPRSAGSVLRFSSITVGANGANAALTFTAASNQTYSIMWKESLDAGEWTKLSDFAAQPTERTETFIDPLPPSTMRVYRLVTPQQPGPVNPMPAILRSPKATSSDFDGTATFDVHATGTSPLTYQWMFNSNSISGANSSTLSIAKAQFPDCGYYSVSVSDGSGVKTSRAVYLGVKPELTSQPQSQPAHVGDSVTLSVTAQSWWPITYRWRHNGRPIPNATNATLTLDNVQQSDTGQYVVIVSHQLPGGRFVTSSSPAVLIVGN
jgi:hypothetical protein